MRLVVMPLAQEFALGQLIHIPLQSRQSVSSLSIVNVCPDSQLPWTPVMEFEVSSAIPPHYEKKIKLCECPNNMFLTLAFSTLMVNK